MSIGTPFRKKKNYNNNQSDVPKRKKWEECRRRWVGMKPELQGLERKGS